MSAKLSSVITRFLSTVAMNTPRKLPPEEFRKLLVSEEAKIGGRLFGPVPDGMRRDFFRVDNQTWAWNEVYPNGAVLTTRYVVSPTSIVAKRDNQPDRVLRGEELKNFADAVDLYAREVRAMYATLRT